MKRASKILTLILVVVFLFGIFAGCDLVGKDVAKYRKATALTIGNQNISVGKLLDNFNSNYNSNYYMIAYGGWTIEDILNMTIQSLISQYMRVDTYTADTNHVQVVENKGDYQNAEYLAQYQLDYSISYVKYLLFTSFDENVMEKIEAKHELKDKEAEDKSRDFYKYDDLGDAKTYAQYYLDKSFKNEDMSEYIETYFVDGEEKFANPSLVDIDKLYLESAEKMVEELNERLDDEAEKISVDEYQKFQKAVIKQYQTSIKNNYGIGFAEFVALQIEDMITSSIINLYNYEIYAEIEKDDNLWTTLKKNYDTLADAQKTKFEVEEGFESYIESLSDDSYIYNVPASYENSYVFVKNILIPFSASQTATLASLKADLGTNKDEDGLYVKYRNWLASQIEADDFNTTKDDKGKYGKLEQNPFVYDNGEVKINPACTALGALLQDGAVTGNEKEDKDAAIKDLMARFNTDVGQHSSLYSYVVYVGEDQNHSHRWVQEFVDATNAAISASKDGGGDGTGYYGIGVSDYGVHIVYVESYVTAIGEINFQDNYLDSSTVEYKLFKTYFEERQKKLLTAELERLQKEYSDKVHETSVFGKFLKENGMSYDLATALKSDDE